MRDFDLLDFVKTELPYYLMGVVGIALALKTVKVIWFGGKIIEGGLF